MTERTKREQAIRALLQESAFLSVQELSARLQVSAMTIRRDLDHLSANGSVQRLHGGAMLRESEASIGQREILHPAEKLAIARVAVTQMRAGETIALDSGTTAAKVAEQLLASTVRPITVVTYALNVALILMADPTIHVHVAGGDLRAGTASVVGPRSRDFFESIHVDRAFLTASGVSAEQGLTNSNFAEAEIKSAMRQAAHRVYALVDASKVDQRGLVRFAALDDVDEMITDVDWPGDWPERLRAAGVVLLVGSPHQAQRARS